MTNEMTMTAPTQLPPGLAAILDQHRRVGLTGAPRSGKTTLADLVPRATFHTDNYMSTGWIEQPRRIIDAVNRFEAIVTSGPGFILEGVQVPRCVRAGLELDAIVWIEYVPEERHRAMTRGMITVLQDVIQSNPSLPIYVYNRGTDTARRFTGGMIDE
jgi:hypothetical protein